MKIKKYRIKPRIHVVAKILKSIMGVRQLPSEVEENLAKEADQFLGRIVPTAFYQTWSRDEIPFCFRSFLQATELSGAVAVSAVVSTIGSEPEDYLAGLLMNGETQRSQITTALCEESADQSFSFILKLLVNDAKSDDCEVSAPMSVSDKSQLQEILALLDATQEEIGFDSALHLTPRFTRVGLVAWCPVAKKRKTTAPSKKRAA